MSNIICSIFSSIYSGSFIPHLRGIYFSLFNKESSGKTIIYRPIRFTKKFITLKENVSIFSNCRVEGISHYGSQNYIPSIILHSGVSVQQNCHITCAQRIEIGSNTALANNVTVTDIDHPYTDISIPIESQDLIVKPVRIGKDCKIYNNAVILQGTIIGDHCVVGANSVVKGIFPDFSIIVGVPARIVKRYDFTKKQWRKTSPNGIFI